MPSYQDKSDCCGARVTVVATLLGEPYAYKCVKCGEGCHLQPLHHRINTVGLGEYTDADLIAELKERHPLLTITRILEGES